MAKVRIEPWRISLDGPVSDYSESLFAVGNGHLGMRGFSLQTPKRRPYDHAVFRAGFFEPIRPGVTDLVQLPDAMGLRVTGEEPGQVSQELDLRTGVFTQRWRGRDVAVEAQRMASMADRQLLCVRLVLTALSDTEAEVRSELDAQVCNLPVHDDQMVEETQTVRLLAPVRQSDRELVMRAVRSGRELRILSNAPQVTRAALRAGERLIVEKRVRVLLDGEAANPDAQDPWAENAAAWEALWRDCDIRLDADGRIQGALRYNIFQMLCANAPDDATVSIGARGLTHGRYKGNVFWDTDVFLLPFFCWHRPGAARSLVQYRLDRLEAARALARRQNLCGARYPWMSGEDGSEQCESWDIGLCETHVTADVAYAADRYREITGDGSLDGALSQMYLETARYWLSRFTWEPGKEQYSSFFVKGPDEYCGAAVNNTFTNYLARHNVRLALRHAAMDDAQRERLRHFEEHVALLYDPQRSLYLQDELFERLEPMPAMHAHGEPLYKSVCFDRMQRYRALKQADLVQLMVMFPDGFTDRQKRAVWEHYEPLTVHDSSLSFGIHALLAFQLGLEKEGWRYFERSLCFDLNDELGNTGREGIHMAALGASWQTLVYGALGLWSDGGELRLTPRLPPEIRGASLCVYHRGRRLRLTVRDGEGRIEQEG